MISGNQCSALSVELPKKQKLREVFVDPSNGKLVIDGWSHGIRGQTWPDLAGFGRIWPDLAISGHESGQFSGQFTAIRAMTANDSQECKVIGFQQFLACIHYVWLIL